MASMPFDVHSAALGGTRQWTRLKLRFVASRAEDRILLTVGNGGAFTGKAWFSGVTLDEASSPATRPPPRSPPSARLTAIHRPAGFICISRASLTSAATSTAT
jgi:hypothetical protein